MPPILASVLLTDASADAPAISMTGGRPPHSGVSVTSLSDRDPMTTAISVCRLRRVRQGTRSRSFNRARSQLGQRVGNAAFGAGSACLSAVMARYTRRSAGIPALVAHRLISAKTERSPLLVVRTSPLSDLRREACHNSDRPSSHCPLDA